MWPPSRSERPNRRSYPLAERKVCPVGRRYLVSEQKEGCTEGEIEGFEKKRRENETPIVYFITFAQEMASHLWYCNVFGIGYLQAIPAL
jgi:hypothetical protein